ncbi:MAG: hypothetical protein HY646_00970 [Acidobacteria bacterium]|nr:hypothetical protein [Acidobacteriota bacterium]
MPKRYRKLSVSVFVLSSFIAFASPAFSQAFVPAKGEGNVTITYQNILARGHLLGAVRPGKLARGPFGTDSIRSHTMTADIEFGITDKAALNLSLPFVTSRYIGEAPHLIGQNNEPITTDDGTYHSAFQDFRFGIRYNFVSRPVFITPFVEGIVPSHDYESTAHSAVGLNLRAVVMGTNVAGFLDLLPGTYFHAQLSHAITQKIAGLRPSRSRVDSEVGYFLTPRLSARFLQSFQTTHDGIVFPQEVTLEQGLNHDRLLRYKFVNLGSGFAFAINESLDVFGTGSKLIWGENVHPPLGFSIGINMHFRTTREAPNVTSNSSRIRVQ